MTSRNCDPNPLHRPPPSYHCDGVEVGWACLPSWFQVSNPAHFYYVREAVVESPSQVNHRIARIFTETFEAGVLYRNSPSFFLSSKTCSAKDNALPGFPFQAVAHASCSRALPLLSFGSIWRI